MRFLTLSLVVVSLPLSLHWFSMPVQGQNQVDSGKAQPWTVSTPNGPKTLNAQLIDMKKGYVLLQDSAGKKHSLPLSKLAEKDRKTALIDRVGSGVVVIQTKDLFDKEMGLGSGFVIHQSGLILTNYHVIAGAGSVKVTFRDVDGDHSGVVLAVDRHNDLALLRVDRVPEGIHVVEIQSRGLPEQGSTVWTVGHPGGLKNTVGWGDVNAVRTTSELPDNLRNVVRAPAESRWLQTDAVLARGSSGGPILNELGQAIGVNTFLAGPQLGFAIHIAHAHQVYLDGRTASPQQLPLPPGEDEDALGWLSREVAPVLQAYGQEYETWRRQWPGQMTQPAYTQLAAIQKKYRQQLLQMARQDPTTWPSLQALTYACSFSNWEEADTAVEEICSLALKHHQHSKHLASIVTQVSDLSSHRARDFCRQAIELSPHEAVQVRARVSLIKNLFQWLQQPDTMDLNVLQGHRVEVKDLLAKLEKSLQEEDDSAIGGRAGQLWITSLRDQLATFRVGQTAPEINGIDAHGERFTLSEYRGKVVLLDFFADWCPHCKRMYPHERQMVDKLKDRPFELLGINCESERVLDQLVKNGTVTWRSWADGQSGPIAQNWKVAAYPTLFLVDHNGIVRWSTAGAPPAEEIDQRIEQLLAEAEGR